uniref:Protein kinase domain-containing protein n=1 Tax=Rhizophagus irregularis (strain DAOM 181602 / DAOM 197198 / MUCL 43194) TaxID=747089 RepID=U9TG02_RHIID
MPPKLSVLTVWLEFEPANQRFQNIFGVGGFGNVYRANWKCLNTVVALKSLIIL